MKKSYTFSPALAKKAERYGIALVALTVAITVAITLFTSHESMVATHATKLPWAAVGWLALATIIESILRFFRYHVAAKALNLPVPLWRMAYYYSVGYALLPTPGKVGTAIRLWLLKQYHGLSYSRTFPLIAMDFLSDAIAMSALACAALIFLHHPALQLLGVTLASGLIALLIYCLAGPKIMRRILKFIYVTIGRRKPKLFARLLRLNHTSSQVLGWRIMGKTILLSFVGWGLVGWGVAHLVTAMGNPLTLAQGTAVITLGTMGGFLSMMPAGVGGAELAMAGLLKMFGTPLLAAVLATALIRLFVLWLTVVIGLILLPFALKNAPNR
ncbi:MAG: UPF0104 family protein [Proteobacteria bacterium]|nr:UPF0104 family protein [Pseudomonadota bacterium]NBX86234.1 UPF0104 family protein [Pseudomonadota bacterium]